MCLVSENYLPERIIHKLGKLFDNTKRKFNRLQNLTPLQRIWHILLTILKWIWLIFLFLYTILPIVWIIISSFKKNHEIFANAIGLPEVWQTQNYVNALHLQGLWPAFRNTIFVAVISTGLVLIISAMAAYALRSKFKANKIIYFFLIVGMYVPVTAFIVPYLVIANVFNIYDTVWALITTYTGISLPISILILKSYMDTIPNEILESAYIDGSSYHRTFIKIMMPLSMPGMASVAIFQFVAVWNEFLFASILTKRETARTLQVSIRYFMGAFQTDYASMFATMAITMIPVILIFILLQERIISGLTSGAIKG